MRPGGQRPGTPQVRPRLRIGRILRSRPVSFLIYAVVMGGLVLAAFDGAAAMGYNWQWYRVPRYFFEMTDAGLVIGPLPRGLAATLLLSAVSFLAALAIGLGLALLRLSDLAVGTVVARGFLEAVRNIPLLVLLYLFYYVLGPILGLDRYMASIGCLAVFHGVLVSEIIRAGILAVPRGQWEAAAAIGMDQAQVYRLVVMPQTLRLILPPMTSELVNVIKNSAIVSVIAVAELTTAGRDIISDSYMSFEIWFTVAAIYLAVTLVISAGATRLERRLAARE